MGQQSAHQNKTHQMTGQLALGMQLSDSATLVNFCWGQNSLLQQQLHATLQGHGDRLYYIWGSEGCGKSHLLQACCQTTPSAIYLPLNLLQEWGPEAIEGLDQQALICIDDIDVIAANPLWEEALFHLYNRVRDNGHSTLIISGQRPPNQTSVTLPDLRSRLGWGLVLQLHELSDEDKISTLQIRAHQRGLELPTSIGQFLLNRCSRNMHDLHMILDKLDTASWIAQRKLTLPFIKTVLGI